MLTTRFAEGLRARPVEARPDRSAGTTWFVTDLPSDREREIESPHEVGLVFIDAKPPPVSRSRQTPKYGAITPRPPKFGKPAIICGGPDDPSVCVLRVDPLITELWDGPSNKIIAAFEFVKAQLTGNRPDLGENRKVTVKMR